MIDQIPQVVCFGEILWDVLPGATLPGGAPMNVAYHLHQLKESPSLITRIGKDERGDALRQILQNKKIDISLLQTDSTHATGVVYGTADNKGDMKYNIEAPVAWDFIQAEAAAIQRVRTSRYFIYGSLASRNQFSRDSLFQILETAQTKVLDVNLRQPFYEEGLIRELIEKADIVKLNNEELELLSAWWNIAGGLKDQMTWLQQTFGLDTIIVTKGARGASLLHNGLFYEHPGFNVQVVDTVGSGDAFLAGFLHKQLQGDEDISQALTFACRLGAFVATRRGAWPEYSKDEIGDLMFS